MYEIDIDPKIFNDAYFPYRNDETRTQIFFGGSSSGKSFFAIGQRMLFDLMDGKRNYLVLRNVARYLRNSVLNEAVQGIHRMGLSHLFKVNVSPPEITCILTGKQALFGGLDDPEKIKSIRPREGVLTDILVEEATEVLDEGAIKQLDRRLRGKSQVKKRMTFLFNPIFKTHWIYERYFKGRWSEDDTKYQDDELLIIKTTYKDNITHLEEDDIKVLEDESDPYWYDVYTLGKWGVLGDLIFTNWETADLEGYGFDTFYNGLDFGYANDPTAATKSTVHKDSIYITDEMVYQKALTNRQIADIIKPKLSGDVIRCDSAEPKSIQELIECGVKAIGAMKGIGSVNYGIQYLQNYRIVIDKRCQNVINEFQLYQWDKDKDGNTINKPIDKYNHAIDSLRYAHEPRMKRKPGRVMTKEEMGFF